jgi:hypothetical protein
MSNETIVAGGLPAEIHQIYASLDVRVFINIGGVVVINKIMGADLPKDRRGGECKSQANPKAAVFG